MDLQRAAGVSKAAKVVLVRAGAFHGATHPDPQHEILIRAPRKIAIADDLCESHARDSLIREATMGQLGFFDAEKRLAALSAKGDPLEAIDRLVPWESFRADIEAVVLTPDEVRKSKAGRKPLMRS